MTGFAIDQMLDNRAAALLLAGLGTITGPAAVVSYVTSRDVNRRWGVDVNLADAVRIAETRPIEWQRDVATRLARRIRRPNDRFAPLAVALLRSSGAEPPDHDPLVTAWLRMMTHPADPLTANLLSRIFVAEGAGRELRDERLTPAPTRWLARVRNELPRDQADRRLRQPFPARRRGAGPPLLRPPPRPARPHARGDRRPSARLPAPAAVGAPAQWPNSPRSRSSACSRSTGPTWSKRSSR